MPERQIQTVASLQQWRGVDQRTQPTLVSDGFVTWSRGLFFGLGDNAERIPGKTVSLKLTGSVFNLMPFGDKMLVQTLDSVQIIPISELLAITTVLTYATDGDANGACYWVGTRRGTAAWTNPHTAGLLTVVISSPDGGTPPDLVDRAANSVSTGNAANSFVGIDLGSSAALRVNNYSIRNRSLYGTDNLRSWKLQGCNSVASNLPADWALASWTDLDTQVANTSIDTINEWLTLPVTLTPVAYRYIRILQTGVNSSGGNHLCMGEFEFYGKFIA